jgi:hypothetical protein
VNIYLGGIAAMFTTLAFFLIAILLMLGVIADSLWGRFRRRSGQHNRVGGQRISPPRLIGALERIRVRRSQ